MGTWNSVPLEITYQVCGWIGFISWSICSYPQVILNYRRKSVVGLSFDYLLLNLTKQSCYFIYNVSLFLSPVVQRQYHEKYGFEEMIPVAASDVAFSTHALLFLLINVYQVFIYERGNQKVSKTSIGITSAVWVSAAVCVFVAWPSHSWLWLISIFNTIQVIMTVIKYIPQAFMNFQRKSTEGWNIDKILLDLLGSVANYGQMAMQSIDQGSWVNFYGNIGKNLLSFVSIFFDLVFMLQHYVLYHSKNKKISSKIDEENSAPLIKSSDSSNSENVGCNIGFGVCADDPVAASDVAFSTHALLFIFIDVYQVFIYERGNQKVSKTSIGITSAVWVSAAICVFVAWPSHSWLWLISIFNTMQVIMTVIKYVPQAFMNFQRKSTEGWNIDKILLDLLGSVANYGQMAMQSIDQGSWVNFYGNIGKNLLSFVSIFFDLVFMLQHYVLYHSKNEKISSKIDEENSAPLIKSSDSSNSENV